MSYKKQLIEAIERTRGNGISVKDFLIESASFPIINNQNGKEIQGILDEHVFNEPFDKVHTQCIHHSWNVQDLISEALNCDVLLTFGYFLNGSQKIFYTSEQEILQWRGMPDDQRRNIHSWLTLPSLEIIDITLMATSGKMAGKEPHEFNYKVFKHYRPDDHYGLPNSIYHTPQFVDDDFLEKVGLLKYL